MAPTRRARRTEGARRRVAPERVFSGRAWVAGRLQPVEVGVDGEGWICAVGRTVSGGTRHDVGERILMPSATDLHVHLREPGPPGAAESIPAGTVGAAIGGVGLVGDMPNTDPPTTTPERLDDKAGRVRGRAAVDVLLYAAPEDPGSLAALARRAGGFKLYLSPTTGIERAPAPAELDALLEALARFDLPVAVHAEEPAVFRDHPVALDPRGWDEARPAAAEAAAVARVLHAPESLRLHIAHVTTAGVASTLRARGLSFEATAHHLLLSHQGGNGRSKVNPPLRSEAQRRALWETFRSGEVPMLASDHAPHPVSSKDGPFELAPSGVPGLETTVPLLLGQAARGDIDLGVVLRAACDRPARWLGQPLGRLSVGHRASLLVVDFRHRQRIAGERLHSLAGWTPFEGWEAVFPAEHWKDGERIVEDGEYVGRPTGRVVRPEFAPGAVRVGPPSASEAGD
jgi:dihydroorotase